MDSGITYYRYRIICDRELWLEHRNLGPNDIKELVELLKHNRVIEHISLDGNPIGEEGGKMLLDFYHSNGIIKTISLRGCNISAKLYRRFSLVREYREILYQRGRSSGCCELLMLHDVDEAFKWLMGRPDHSTFIVAVPYADFGSIWNIVGKLMIELSGATKVRKALKKAVPLSRIESLIAFFGLDPPFEVAEFVIRPPVMAELPQKSIDQYSQEEVKRIIRSMPNLKWIAVEILLDFYEKHDWLLKSTALPFIYAAWRAKREKSDTRGCSNVKFAALVDKLQPH